MEPTTFPQASTKLAKNQPQYRPLPVDIIEGNKVNCPACGGTGNNLLKAEPCDKCKGRGVFRDFNKYVFKYRLSNIELAQVLLTGHIWFQQSGYAFNPILPSVETPYGVVVIQYVEKESGKFDFYFPYVDGEGIEKHQLIEDADPYLYIKSVLESCPEYTAEQLFFVERPAIAVSEEGKIETI